MPLEVPLAPPVIDQQMLGEKRRDDHAQAVVHPAGFVELPHRGVDDRVAGAAFAPRREVRLVNRDTLALSPPRERSRCDVRKVSEDLLIEIAPDQLADPRVDSGRPRTARGAARLAALRRRTCECRSCRRASAARAATWLASRRHVAFVRIRGDAFGDEAFEYRARAPFAALRVARRTRVPVLGGSGTARVSPIACRAASFAGARGRGSVPAVAARPRSVPASAAGRACRRCTARRPPSRTSCAPKYT